MATITLNRATHVLRIDLTDLEFLILDPYVNATGTAGIEQTIVSFIQTIKQVRREQDLHTIRERIDSLPDAKRDAILAIMGG